VDFELTGPAMWRGVNEYMPKSINNTYLDTKCDINRVFSVPCSSQGDHPQGQAEWPRERNRHRERRTGHDG
jgi:hypothetical protein